VLLNLVQLKSARVTRDTSIDVAVGYKGRYGRVINRPELLPVSKPVITISWLQFSVVPSLLMHFSISSLQTFLIIEAT